ncbi:hypothetical protein Mgra_00004946 [Meloidogyne graminicola]|uniref:Uncharacterized protein n=1 Tax=Meloidogyne graminicola TaxID=189291 RepID=A0A8S9ZQW7_9BILA|nr:hypothetical protein Mgra_00004946 [Meloidogyne graminicola]
MLSDYPLPISLVNFFSSEAVGHAIKKHFHFLFGPPSVVDKCETDIPAEVIRSSLTSKLDGFLDNEEGEVKNEKENIYKYQPNEFIPEITTKSILEVCKREGINKEEIAYISNSASQYLPDDAEIIRKKFKAFVFSPLEDKFNPRQRPSFRPPTFQSPHFSIELIKALYSGRTEDWNWAINNRTPALRIQNLSSIPSPWSDNETTFSKIKEKREEKLKVFFKLKLNYFCFKLIKETLQKQKELINNLKLNKNIINLKQQNKFITQAMTKQRFGNRKYSREVNKNKFFFLLNFYFF